MVVNNKTLFIKREQKYRPDVHVVVLCGSLELGHKLQCIIPPPHITEKIDRINMVYMLSLLFKVTQGLSSSARAGKIAGYF